MDGARYNASLYCDGDVNVSRFVKPGSADYHCLQAGAGEAVIGISQAGSQLAPTSVNDSLAGRIGGPAINVFTDTDICHLKIGAGGITQGALLKSDANGQGIALTTPATDLYGARALETAAAGELCRVQVKIKPA